VIIEAKQGTATDATSKVIGQLMMYYAGALQLGTRGLRHLRTFATQRPVAARSARPKSLRMLSAGCTPPEAAWEEMCRGRKIGPGAIGLYIALDAPASPTLCAALETLRERHGLPVGVVSVLQRDRLAVWPDPRSGRLTEPTRV
jgi:hypothetical protein